MKFPYTWYEMSWSLLSLCRTVWTLTLNVLWDFPPTHTPLYSMEGWKPGTAVPGLLHLQGKGTEIFENRSIEFVPVFSRCEFTVLCRIYERFAWTGYFRIQSGFMVEKKIWQGIFSYLNLENIQLISDKYQITTCYLFFSKVMWSHRHCREWRRCFRCKAFHTHQPISVPLFQRTKICPQLCGLFVLVARRSQYQPEMAFELGQCHEKELVFFLL